MTELESSPEKKRLTCPICNSTFLNIFPAGECQKCHKLVCGHCIHHDNPDHAESTCQDCVEKMTPYGRISQMDQTQLFDILKDTSSKDSSMVARLLGDRKDNAFVDPLCHALKYDRIDVRREAAIALGKLKSNQAVPDLLIALNDSAPAVRSRVISSLAELGVKDALPQIKNQLKNPSRQVAGYAVAALEKLMGHDAIDILKDLVKNHKSSFIRCEALAILARLNHESALAAALKCLDDSKKEVIICACKIIGKLNDLEAAAKLQELIEKEPSPSVRITATATLNKLVEPKT